MGFFAQGSTINRIEQLNTSSTINITKDSNDILLVTGSSSGAVVLPDCTTVVPNRNYTIINRVDANGVLFVRDQGGTQLKIVAPESTTTLFCVDNSTADGVWESIDNSSKYDVFTAGEPLDENTSVYISNGPGPDGAREAGKVYKVDPKLYYRKDFIGLTVHSVGADDLVLVVKNGKYDGFPGTLVPGGKYFCDPAIEGGLTLIEPDTPEHWRVNAGIAISDRILHISMDRNIEQVDPLRSRGVLRIDTDVGSGTATFVKVNGVTLTDLARPIFPIKTSNSKIVVMAGSPLAGAEPNNRLKWYLHELNGDGSPGALLTSVDEYLGAGAGLNTGLAINNNNHIVYIGVGYSPTIQYSITANYWNGSTMTQSFLTASAITFQPRTVVALPNDDFVTVGDSVARFSLSGGASNTVTTDTVLASGVELEFADTVERSSGGGTLIFCITSSSSIITTLKVYLAGSASGLSLVYTTTFPMHSTITNGIAVGSLGANLYGMCILTDNGMNLLVYNDGLLSVTQFGPYQEGIGKKYYTGTYHNGRAYVTRLYGTNYAMESFEYSPSGPTGFSTVPDHINGVAVGNGELIATICDPSPATTGEIANYLATGISNITNLDGTRSVIHVVGNTEHTIALTSALLPPVGRFYWVENKNSVAIKVDTFAGQQLKVVGPGENILVTHIQQIDEDSYWDVNSGNNKVLVDFIAGENITNRKPVYASSANPGQVFLYDGSELAALNFIGFSTGDASTGETIVVQAEGILGGFSGLISGKIYYAAAGGALNADTTTSPYPILVALALDAETVIIKRVLSSVRLLHIQDTTPDRLLSTDANRRAVSTNLGDWVAGTGGITVTDNGAGGINIGGVIGSLAADRLVRTNGSGIITTENLLSNWISGTANRIVVTDVVDGKVNVSLPNAVSGLTSLSATTLTGTNVNGTTVSGTNVNGTNITAAVSLIVNGSFTFANANTGVLTSVSDVVGSTAISALIQEGSNVNIGYGTNTATISAVIPVVPDETDVSVNLMTNPAFGSGSVSYISFFDKVSGRDAVMIHFNMEGVPTANVLIGDTLFVISHYAYQTYRGGISWSRYTVSADVGACIINAGSNDVLLDWGSSYIPAVGVTIRVAGWLVMVKA